jgi:hypothetical protein
VLDQNHVSCLEDLYIPPSDPRLFPADLPPARNPPPEPALFDWCLSQYVDGSSMILQKPPRFYYESGPVGTANVHYSPDPATNGRTGTYDAGLTRTGTYTLDFPALCMPQIGAMAGRPAASPDNAQGPMVAGGPPVDLSKQLEVPLRDSGVGEGSYPNTTCIPNKDDPGGCLCAFDVSETGGGGGNYQILSDGKTILHVPGDSFPQKVTYCHTSGRLQLTGYEGQYLYGQRGLRTLDLVLFTPNCTDGLPGQGEDGVDCGGSCPTACPDPAAM